MNSKPDIKKILKKGFARLEIDKKTAYKAADEILEYAKAEKDNSRYFRTRLFRADYIFALAATVVLCLVSILFVLNLNKKNGINGNDCVISEQANRKHSFRNLVVLSAVGDSELISKVKNTFQDQIVTDEESQLLFAIGSRTRAILYENSSININKIDSVNTSIVLEKGLLAVDVAKGKRDTLSISTSFGVFTHIGTRFSVYVDPQNGAVVKVYEGKVKVKDKSGTETIVEKNRAWNSKNRLNVLHFQPGYEENEIENVFLSNKIKHRISWEKGTYEFKKNNRIKYNKRKPVCKNATNLSRNNLSEIETGIKNLITENDFISLKKNIKKIENCETLNNVYRLLKAEAKRKCDVFRYHDAVELMKIVVYNNKFGISQREDAWIQYYMLHKKYLRTSAEKKLELAKEYINVFPMGSWSVDMMSEAIHFQLILDKYRNAAELMKVFIKRYPESSNCEYFSYLLASTLREQLKNYSEALKFYRNYVLVYPYGRYEEEALYWIIQLSLSEGDKKLFSKYRDVYLERYSKGKWSKELKSLSLRTIEK